MNKTSIYQLTIVVPVYNEAENISRLEQKLSQYLPNATCSACVLFVDDGSTDNSLALIRETCQRHAKFFYIALERNGGLSAALKAGIDTVESQYIGYIDADLQTAPEDFNLLLTDIDTHELVMGIRTNRKDTLFKKVQSRVANGFRRIMTGDGVEDTGCPLKVMHTSCAKRIPMFNGMHRFLPALVLLQNGRVKQTPVRHFPRVAGKSKYNLWNRMVAPFIDCFAYRWMRKRYINYHIECNNVIKA